MHILMSSLLFLGFACAEEENAIEAGLVDAEILSSSGVSPSVVDDWVEYFQSSDNGLWEDSVEHHLSYREMGHLYDEDNIDVPVYSPFAVCCYSDTIFVTDAITKEIVALDIDGNVLWKTGGEGEGPGEFSLITTLAVSAMYVAAPNIHLGRVDLFHRDGSFFRCYPIDRPQDIVTLDDTTFIVGSTEAQGGDFHLLNAHQGFIRSFGRANMNHYDGLLRPDLMRLCSNGERIAVFNRYEGLLAIYDIETEECIFMGSRDYPAEPTPPQSFTNSEGDTRTVFFPIGGNAFLGPEGMLNVIVCNYMDDGTFISDPEYLDFAPVTGIDRYDWNGTYLDSYCLPDSSINFVSGIASLNQLVGVNFAEDVICGFERK